MRIRARWSLHHAKAQFSEVVRRSLADGPQVVSKNGADAVVVVSMRDFERLQPVTSTSLATMLAESPLRDVTLDVRRSRSSGRPVRL
jgi:prevent-host-death family protein